MDQQYVPTTSRLSERDWVFLYDVPFISGSQTAYKRQSQPYNYALGPFGEMSGWTDHDDGDVAAPAGVETRTSLQGLSDSRAFNAFCGSGDGHSREWIGNRRGPISTFVTSNGTTDSTVWHTFNSSDVHWDVLWVEDDDQPCDTMIDGCTSGSPHFLAENQPESQSPTRSDSAQEFKPFTSASLPLRIPDKDAQSRQAWKSPCQSSPSFICTSGCSKTTLSPYEYKRHDATHWKTWICMPDGTPGVEGRCGLCGKDDVSAEHLGTHVNLEGCISSGRAYPAFRGRDKLIDHIKCHLSDGVPTEMAMMRADTVKAWRRTEHLPSIARWCGFCQEYCATLEDRQNEVIRHVHAGAQLSDWVLPEE